MRKMGISFVAVILCLLLCACSGPAMSSAPTPKPLPTVEECEQMLKEKLPAARSLKVSRQADFDGIGITFDEEDVFEPFSRHLLDAMYACMEIYGENEYVTTVVVYNPEAKQGITGDFMPDYEDEFCDVSYTLGDKRVHESYETLEAFLAAYPIVNVK